jgi:toxin ParE1/3/4
MTEGGSFRSVILRASARRDVEEAVAHYLEEGGSKVAVRFIDALETAFAHIARNPESGSPRYGHELNLAGLRSWLVPSHPYLIFYLEGQAAIDVWRIPHGRRDIPGSLRGGDRPVSPPTP